MITKLPSKLTVRGASTSQTFGLDPFPGPFVSVLASFRVVSGVVVVPVLAGFASDFVFHGNTTQRRVFHVLKEGKGPQSKVSGVALRS
jgi:hypothetical protein